MRIDAYRQVTQLYNTSQTKSVQKANKPSGRDALEISSTGSAYQIAKQAVKKGSDVREDRVEEIKAQLDAGTYKVSMEDVADKMVERLLA